MPGYCDPPAEHRFKKGQSGNPGGGPRGPRRLPSRQRVTFLDEKLRCSIGAKPFYGKRSEALMHVATRIAIIKKDIPLQQLILKLKAQLDEKQSHIQRDDPLLVIAGFPTPADWVSCIEDAADVAGFGKKAYRNQKTARILLESWVIEEGLEKLGDKKLNREEQEMVLAAARYPAKISWPGWWDPDLRRRGKGWRANPMAAIEPPPPPPSDEIRMNVKDYLRIKMEEENRRSAIEMEGALREHELELAQRLTARGPGLLTGPGSDDDAVV